MVLWMSVFLFACNSGSNKPDQVATDSPGIEKSVAGKNHLEILDFYGTHRCTTCKNIEANTRYTLNTNFKDEVKNGTIVFKTINFDDPKNEEIVEAYFAYGTSLFFNVVKDGQEEHIDLSAFSFERGNNKDEYASQLTKKINKVLEKLEN